MAEMPLLCNHCSIHMYNKTLVKPLQNEHKKGGCVLGRIPLLYNKKHTNRYHTVIYEIGPHGNTAIIKNMYDIPDGNHCHK